MLRSGFSSHSGGGLDEELSPLETLPSAEVDFDTLEEELEPDWRAEPSFSLVDPFEELVE